MNLEVQRRKVPEALRAAGITSRFSLQTMGLSSLAGGDPVFCVLKDWKPNTRKWQAVKDALKPFGVIPATTRPQRAERGA